MASWRASLATTLSSWVEAQGAIRASILVSDPTAPGTFPASGSTLTYTLYDDANAAVITGTATSSGGPEFIFTGTPGAARPPSGKYRARWLGTGDLSSIDAWCDVRATRHAMVMRYGPVTTLDLLSRFPSLTDYPTGSTSWNSIIPSAWYAVARRVFREAPMGEDWSPDQYAEPCLHLAAAMIYEQASTFSGGAWMDMGRYHRQLYEAFWSRAVIATDVDGDGDIDDASHTDGPSSAIGPRT